MNHLEAKEQTTIVDSNSKSALKEDFTGKVDSAEIFGFGVTLEKDQSERYITKADTVYCCILCCMQSGAGSITE